MRILLDTHILIWILANNKSLSAHHKLILTDTSNEKIVSQFTFIELAIKINIGKLPDFNEPMDKFMKQVENDGFKILPINKKHIVAFASLPLVFGHRDPFDRFLIPTAVSENMSIITLDEKFKAYQHLVKLL
ncbi:MAG: type II toxin-antitoxin system VapC family toxin [Ginsengibacter sp.]